MGAVDQTSAVDFQGGEDPSQYYEEEGENEYLEPYLTHAGEAPTTSKNLGKQMNILAVPVRPKTQNIRARLTTSVPLTEEIIRQRRYAQQCPKGQFFPRPFLPSVHIAMA